mmetsp:Transcript_35291/g.70371  ORF Transcript_35291/g.70371 Transcript_35291/m.70371 type:complete len:232 (-) Transcript_35291:120-815(-)
MHYMAISPSQSSLRRAAGRPLSGTHSYPPSYRTPLQAPAAGAAGGAELAPYAPMLCQPIALAYTSHVFSRPEDRGLEPTCLQRGDRSSHDWHNLAHPLPIPPPALAQAPHHSEPPRLKWPCPCSTSTPPTFSTFLPPHQHAPPPLSTSPAALRPQSRYRQWSAILVYHGLLIRLPALRCVDDAAHAPPRVDTWRPVRLSGEVPPARHRFPPRPPPSSAWLPLEPTPSAWTS